MEKLSFTTKAKYLSTIDMPINGICIKIALSLLYRFNSLYVIIQNCCATLCQRKENSRFELSNSKSMHCVVTSCYS